MARVTVRRAVAGAMATILSAAVPPFLVGALAPRIAEDMVFGPSQVGLAMAICYTTAGILSPLGGRVVERIGAGTIARVTCALSTLGLVGIATSTTAAHIYASLVLVGLANTLSQPTTNQLLSEVREGPGRAVSFGVVQASIPSASLVAGALFAVASGALTWRWSISLVIVLTLAAQIALPRGNAAAPHSPELPASASTAVAPTSGGRPVLLTLVLTGFLASAAATSVPSFATSAGLALGMAPLLVGSSQVVGSVGSVIMRIAAPTLVSRTGPATRMRTIAGLVTIGAGGFVLLGTGTQVGFLIGSALVFACGWGWNSLYNLLVASSQPDRVAASTGLTQAGIFLGGTSGPLLFALIVEGYGFSPAWFVMGAVMMAAGASAWGGARALSPTRRSSDPPDSARWRARRLQKERT